uniref:Uncharacterized protein n=1 Tax=Arundo donax TaxID=35708 RepID=A0A0A9HX48_ARUDO
MTPARPNCRDSSSLCYLHDELYICIVVIICSTGNFYKLVGDSYVLSVYLQVLRSRHSNQKNRLLCPKGLQCPRADAAHELDRCHAIVRN